MLTDLQLRNGKGSEFHNLAEATEVHRATEEQRYTGNPVEDYGELWDPTETC